MKLTKGFSLIEIMVVIGVMGILLAIGVASYNRMNERLTVDETAKAIAAGLISAQKEATSGAGSRYCDVGHRFVGVWVEWVLADRQYRVQARCNGGSDYNRPTPQRIPEKKIPNQINITAAPSMVFLSMTGGISSNATISINSGTHVRDIRVTRSGGISVVTP